MKENETISKKEFNHLYSLPSKYTYWWPKCLHQLGYELQNVLKEKVYMYYFSMSSEKHDNPVHENYQIYKIPFTNKIEDSKDNLLIVPEMNKTIKISQNFKNIQKILWWI